MAEDTELKTLVAEVAAAYFSNSHVTPSEIPTVINQIAASLSSVGAPASTSAEAAPEQPKLSSGQIRKSITRDALISFEDNKPYKTLRRHLASKGLTPEQYREKWGLPKDYPMVSPSYSEARAQMARAIGLGSRVSSGPRGRGAAAAAESGGSSAPARRGRAAGKGGAKPGRRGKAAPSDGASS